MAKLSVLYLNKAESTRKFFKKPVGPGFVGDIDEKNYVCFPDYSFSGRVPGRG